MTKQKEQIELTPLQLDQLYHDALDLIGKHGSFTGSKFHEAEEGDQAIELTAYSPDDEDFEVVALVYIRGERLKEIQEGGE